MNDNYLLYPLKYAIDVNDTFALYDLIEKSHPNTLAEALIYSIYEGRYDICKILVGSNANFEYVINQYNYSSSCDRSTPFIDLLRRHYFDLAEKIENKGYTLHIPPDVEPLVVYEAICICDAKWKNKILNSQIFSSIPVLNIHKIILCAIANDDASTVVRLIPFIPSINYQDENGDTFLHIACSNNSPNVLKELILSKADAHIKNKNCKTPLHLLCSENKNVALTPSMLILRIKSQYFSAVFSRIQKESKRYIVKKSKIEEDFQNLFQKKSQSDHRANKHEILKTLPSSSFDISDNEGNTALHLAIKNYQNRDFIEVLLKNGANPNALNHENKTPFHLISSPWEAALLIQHNAALNMLDNTNCSPLECAIYRPIFDDFDPFFTNNQKPLIYIEHVENILQYCIENRTDFSILIKYLFSLIPLRKSKAIFSNYLQIACSKNCSWLITFLLKQGCDVHQKDNNGNSLLHLLFNENFLAKNNCVKVLLDHGLDINIRDKNGYSSLELVINSALPRPIKCSAIEILIKNGANIDLKNDLGQNILHILSQNSNTALLLPFIFKRSDSSSLNEQDNFGRTPLHYLLTGEYYTETLTAKELFDLFFSFLKYGADPNLTDKDGRTPLHYLFANTIKGINLQNFISLLEEYDFNFNVKDSYGRNFLHYAAWYTRCDSIDKFILMGLSILEKDINQKIPIDYFWEYYCDFGYRNISDVRFCKAFDKLLPDIYNVRFLEPFSNESILIKAVRSFQNPHLSQLLKMSVDLNHRDILDMNALDWACAEGNSQAFELLIKTGAKRKLFNNNNDSYLHFAAFGFYTEYSIEDITPLYSNIDMPNNYGMTPYAAALLAGKKYICMCLLKLGARINPPFNPKNFIIVNESIILNPNHFPLLVYETVQGLCYLTKKIVRANSNSLLSIIAENGLTGSLMALNEILNTYETGFRKNFDIDHVDQLGWTAMHWAAFWGNKKIIELLIEMGADQDIRTIHGETPGDIYSYFLRYT